jgi:hypothetical protein
VTGVAVLGWTVGRLETLLPARLATLTTATAAASATAATTLALGTSFIDVQRAAGESLENGNWVVFLSTHFHKVLKVFSACASLGVHIEAVTGGLLGQIISLPLCALDFIVQVRQFAYVTTGNRLSRNVCFAPLSRFHVSVGRESVPSV